MKSLRREMELPGLLVLMGEKLFRELTLLIWRPLINNGLPWFIESEALLS